MYICNDVFVSGLNWLVFKKMSKTFFKYFLRMQIKIMFFVACFVIGFVFIFTFADMMRKIPSDAVSPLGLCVYLSLLRIPYTCCELAGYIYLIAATFSLWNLSQSHEITVLKSIGKSSRQILLPYFFLSFLIGVSFVFVVQPACVKIERFADYQDKEYLSKSTMYSNYLWLKNKDEIIFMRRLFKTGINTLSVINYKTNEALYANAVKIMPDGWKLLNGYIRTNDVTTAFKERTIQKVIADEELEVYSIPPQNCSIYALLHCLFAKKTYTTDVSKYIISLNKLFANGVIFFLFSMIAAIVCLPLNRYKTKTFVSGGVCSSAILLRLFSGICESMGGNGTLPPIICIWLPMIIAFSLALALLIWKEE